MDNTDTLQNIIADAHNDRFHKLINKYLMGFFISQNSGALLYSKTFNWETHESLMVNFISALAIFGEENLGKIRRIVIEGLNIEMAIITKHNLILSILFRPNMVKDYLQEEAEKGLELFYQLYKTQIEAGKTNSAIYQKFDEKMYGIVHAYLERINVL